MINEFDWWTRALAGDNPEIYADAPQSGFYRMRLEKNGPWQPVMIRLQDGILRCRVGNDSGYDPLRAWTYCANNPVSKAAARHAFDTGQWEGDAPPPIGDNSASLSLVDQLRDYVAGTLAWLKGRKIEDKPSADQAANRRAEILRLKGLVEKEWDAKALPHDQALSDLKKVYDSPVKEAENVNTQLRTLATEFARAEERRQRAEADAKHQAELKAAAAARAAVEEQRAKQKADDPIAFHTTPEPELPPLPAAPAPVKIALGGQAGKVAGLKSYWEAEITDHKAALAHYANHPDVVALIQKLAKADSKTSKGTAAIPGVRCYEDRRVA